ncbi:MAG: ABC transporter ATP-binding protein [Elusimicrobia bacterium]|nr:ABC transporter ATP-binding protein [Elusimicrobiota bacterium]
MPDSPHPFALELKGISKSFGSQLILKNLNLQVREGEFLTFLGPSGCGKTTTLRIVAGFEHPDQGEVFMEGKPISHLPPYQREVHTVFQHYALFPHYDVYGNIAFPLKIKKFSQAEIQKRVEGALRLVQLEGYGSRRISQISGGQQQRVALARALVGQPKLLLLDEPLGALDFKLRKEMQLELKRIQRQLGVTFIYVTHDQEEALTLSDRVAVFRQGEMEQIGTPKEIYEKPRSPFVADFIGSANIFTARFVRCASGIGEFLVEGEKHWNLPMPSGILKEGEEVQLAVRPEKVQLISAEPKENSGICFTSPIKDCVYLGSMTQVFLSPFSHSSKSLLAVFPGSWGRDKKTSTWIRILPEDVLILGCHNKIQNPEREKELV